jgi:hypothetical protein
MEAAADQVMSGKKEIKAKPAARSIAKEFGGDPGLPPAWLAAQEAQIRMTRLQLRARALVPAMLCLIVGIALGILSIVPLIAKCAVGGAAGVVLGWAMSSYRIQARRADAAYRAAAPRIKVK